MSEKMLVESGENPHLLELLKQKDDPAYKKWRAAGCPRGNAGILIYAERFEIRPNRQVFA